MTEEVAHAPVELRVLGELTARRAGAPVDLGGRRQRAVLALLVIARGEAVSAEALAAAVWGDDARAGSSTAALQSYVSHLRRRLEPDAEARTRAGIIASSGPGYVLRLPPHAVDAWRFEHLVHQAASSDPVQAATLLEEGLRLWRGPAYADYAFEAWAEPEVARLTELRGVARERALEARLATGDAALLVPELEALVTEQPLREDRWRLLVLALYRAHRQADALAALRRARQILADELGVDPGPALRALETEVLNQSPTLDVPAQRGPDPLVVPASSEVVGRDREMRAVADVVGRVAGGESSVLVVEGAAGMGKTTLLHEVTRLSTDRGMRVLSARGSQLERSLGFGAVRQLFEPCLLDASTRSTLLRGAADSARGVFEQIGGDPLDGSFSVLHGLYWLTVNLAADGPLVLAVDDVQWCDTGSLRFLAYLVKRLEGLSVLMVVTLRTGEQHEDEDLLAELALDPSTTSVRPAALGPDDVARLVALRLGPPAAAFSAACHKTTGGNPLLLRQLLRALEAEGVKPDLSHTDTVRAVGSRAISSLVLMRLRRMSADATAAARAVAVLGDGASLPQVAALAALAEDRCALALAALSRAEVLRDEERLSFVHPLVRDAVYGDVPAAERALHHERAARILQQHGAMLEQVAAHLVLTPRRGDAATVVLLRAAARTAGGRGAADTAVALLRRALDEPALGPERVGVLLELGRLEQLVDGPAAAAHLAEAYPFLDDPSVRAEAAICLARTHVFASPAGVATAFARDAAAALPSDLGDQRQGLLALQRITGFMHSLDPEKYRAGPEPDVLGGGDGARMLAAALAFEHVLAGSDRERTVALARFALDGDRLLHVDTGLFWVIAANALELADADVGDFWERAQAHAHRTGALFLAMTVNLWRGWIEWRRGELAEALASLTESKEQQRMWRGELAYSYIGAFAAGVHLDRGDVAAARAELAETADRDLRGEGGRLAHEMTARVLVAEGRPGEALAALEAAVDPLGIANPAWASWRGIRATALHALGRTADAVALLEEEVALLRLWGAPSALGRSLRLLGETSCAAGVPVLREAVELLSGGTMPLELARARLSLGRSADVSDEEAARLLELAADGAAACGADGVRREALDELRGRGRALDLECDRRATPTRTELRVADLAAQGLDEREIAQQLFLTPGTVRTFLERVAARVDG